MVHVNIFSIVGLILNALSVFFIYSSLTNAVGVPEVLIDALLEAKTLYLISLVLQFLSLVIIEQKKYILGLILSAIGSIMFIPIGVVGFSGCVISYLQGKYDGFNNVVKPELSEKSYFLNKSRALTYLPAALIVAFFIMPIQLIGFFIVGIFYSIYYIAKVKNQPYVSICKQKIYIRPLAMLKYVMLNYKDIESAKIEENGLVTFTIKGSQGNLTLSWSIFKVAPELQKELFEDLKNVLIQNDIPLSS